MSRPLPAENQPDPDRIVPHVAVQALVALRAFDDCLDAVDGPHASGTLWALRSMHEPAAVEGLIKKLGSVHDLQRRRGILVALIRLYYREADYDGSWWGIRPDSTGPYYDRREWGMSPRIGAVLTAAYADAVSHDAVFLKRELGRHQVSLPAVPQDDSRTSLEPEKPIEALA